MLSRLAESTARIAGQNGAGESFERFPQILSRVVPVKRLAVRVETSREAVKAFLYCREIWKVFGVSALRCKIEK